MATFYLLNTTTVGTQKYFAGDRIDEALHPKAAIEAGGGVCWPSTDTTVSAAAALCATLRKAKARNEAELDTIMKAAAEKSLRSRGHAAAGTDLTDADQTIQASEGEWRQMPTVTAARNVTLGTTDAIAGDQITITRTSTSAFAVAVLNGGAGAGTLISLVASKASYAKFQFDGTNWELREFGVAS